MTNTPEPGPWGQYSVETLTEADILPNRVRKTGGTHLPASRQKIRQGKALPALTGIRLKEGRVWLVDGSGRFAAMRERQVGNFQVAILRDWKTNEGLKEHVMEKASRSRARFGALPQEIRTWLVSE